MRRPLRLRKRCSTLNVYAFPQDGQAADQQTLDEAECYQWAVNNTGSDPFTANSQVADASQEAQEAQQQATNSARGAGAGGRGGVLQPVRS